MLPGAPPTKGELGLGSLTWLGHAAFMLGSDRGKRIYVDPFLQGNPKCPEAEQEPERVDIIAITHGHSDHVGQTVELSKKFKPDIVAQVELKSWLRSQGANVGELPGLNKGGSTAIDGITYALVNAFHSSSNPDGGYAGEPCGLVVRLEEGRTIYFTVEARDERELIGDGTHERVVVNVEKFDQRVQRKLSQ